jgi:hypothetical protein
MATTGHRHFLSFIQHSSISLSIHGLVQMARMKNGVVLGGQAGEAGAFFSVCVRSSSCEAVTAPHED